MYDRKESVNKGVGVPNGVRGTIGAVRVERIYPRTPNTARLVSMKQISPMY